MFERDYICKLIADLLLGIVKSLQASEREENPYLAAQLLETAIGNAVDMDASVFLSLSPESMSSIMAISHTDDESTEYIARSLMLASEYNEKAGSPEIAQLRRAQAYAVADAYGHDISDMEDGNSEEIMRELVESQE